MEQIGLVDHQHAAAGLLHDALHGTLGVAPEGAYEAAAVAYDDVAQGERAGLAQERAEDLADGRLARAGIAQEDAVEGDGVGLGAGHEARELAVESREGDELVDARLDVGAALQTLERLARMGLGVQDAQLDLRVVVELHLAVGVIIPLPVILILVFVLP